MLLELLQMLGGKGLPLSGDRFTQLALTATPGRYQQIVAKDVVSTTGCWAASQVYQPQFVQAEIYVPGFVRLEVHQDGFEAAQGGCHE